MMSRPRSAVSGTPLALVNDNKLTQIVSAGTVVGSFDAIEAGGPVGLDLGNTVR